MCLTTFSVLPWPRPVWDEEARPKMPLFLPLLGVLLGGICAAAAYLLRLFALPQPVGGVLLCALPFLLTGGIHMDGFCDTVDALKSRRDLDERRKILKDPHVGSFAVLSAALLVVAQFAFFTSAGADADPRALILIFTASRTAAALAVTVLRPIAVSRYAGIYQEGIPMLAVVLLSLILVLSVTLGFLFLGKYGFAALFTLGGYLLYLFRGVRALGGMSGDISGYALTFGELCGIALYALI